MPDFETLGGDICGAINLQGTNQENPETSDNLPMWLPGDDNLAIGREGFWPLPVCQPARSMCYKVRRILSFSPARRVKRETSFAGDRPPP